MPRTITSFLPTLLVQLIPNTMATHAITYTNYGFILLLKSFTDNELKFKARLKTNFKCMCVTMCSLVMSLFSRDYIKTEID